MRIPEPVVLLDRIVSGARFERILNLAPKGLCILNAASLTLSLILMDIWDEVDPSHALVAFPGAGAKAVAAFLFRGTNSRILEVPAVSDATYRRFYDRWDDRYRHSFFPAKRFWEPGSDPWAQVECMVRDRLVFGVKDVIVVDDVISSGATMRTVRRLNEPWIPGARWHAVTWVKQRSTRLTRFDSVRAAAAVGDAGTKVPIVSFSTLCEDREIAQSFAQRNRFDVNDIERFIHGVEQELTLGDAYDFEHHAV